MQDYGIMTKTGASFYLKFCEFEIIITILTISSYRKDITEHRVKRWSFDIKDLLSDPAGKEHFKQFLEKEFSYENLR